MVGVIDVGGGTRGIFGAGVFDYCMDNGIEFDLFIGVSAGSANGSSYLSRQRGRNLVFYDNYAFRRKYMSVWNMLTTGEFINLDYIYSTLSNSDGEDPLDYNALADNPTDFEIVTTNTLTGKPHYFPKSSIKQDCYDVIKASCAVPVASKPYPIDGVPYYDGGLSDPIPYKRAFEKGCDKLVVVLTRPKDSFRKPDGDKKFVQLVKRKYSAAAEVIRNRYKVYNQSLREILELEKQGKVLIIAPDDISGLKTLTKDHEPLRKLYAKGYAAAERIKPFLND